MTNISNEFHRCAEYAASTTQPPSSILVWQPTDQTVWLLIDIALANKWLFMLSFALD